MSARPEADAGFPYGSLIPSQILASPTTVQVRATSTDTSSTGTATATANNNKQETPVQNDMTNGDPSKPQTTSSTAVGTSATPLAHSMRKKPRWTREEKRQRKENEQKGLQQSPKADRKVKEKPKFGELLLSCAEKAMHTEGVSVQPPLTGGEGTDTNRNGGTVVITCESISSPFTPGSSATTTTNTTDRTAIHVKPLLILDLNGILCHRIRKNHSEAYVGTPYRPYDADTRIAHTPIVHRPDIAAWLDLLAPHFVLAVWTSAKSKTATKLLDLLMADTVRSRLLFVWSQSQCQLSEDGVWLKPLQKVYESYPLWNDRNTLLLDDTPAKCLIPSNTLHPPALHGKAIVGEQSDESNVSHQLDFFRKLIQHFGTARVTTNVSKSEDGNRDKVTIDTCQEARSMLMEFLQLNAVQHMGWRGDRT